VDAAVGSYLATMKSRGKVADPEGVRAETLAHLVGVSREKMSTWLQDYRKAGRTTRTRYTISGEGYGTSARWKILRRPGRDYPATQRRRTEHALHSCRDGCARIVMDFACEVAPAAVSGSVQDAQINIVRTMVEQQLEAMLYGVVNLLNLPPATP